MQIFASVLRSCLLLVLSTGSLGQSVPASALEEIRGELHQLRAELAEVKEKNTALKNELRVELAEDVRALFQTQPRRTFENNFEGCMSHDKDSGDIIFEGCNIHIRSGEGSTEATPNGKGNLIIGYNEPAPESAENSRDGSHNLIIGDQHKYTSYGGIVTGWSNSISNFYSAVVGGYRNSATGEYSTVTGGIYNEASGEASSISGGHDNTASGIRSSVSGGDGNQASGQASSISGGSDNTASGYLSSVLGGRLNDARGEEAVVTGGLKNRANKLLTVVVGGKKLKAAEKLSVVTGA